jgi:hypothetical protein
MIGLGDREAKDIILVSAYHSDMANKVYREKDTRPLLNKGGGAVEVQKVASLVTTAITLS